MKFSIILCTCFREKELVFFLDSLSRQNYTEYELIVIDQNDHDSIKFLLNTYAESIKKIKYFHVNFKGLSKSRNYGLKFVSQDTDVICFPDDDCEYPPKLFNQVVDNFIKFSYIDFLSCKTVDKLTNKNSAGRWINYSAPINFQNVWRTANSTTIFIKSHCKNDIYFDEKLGVGAETEFHSGEETDVIINLLKLKYKGIFFINMNVFHPNNENIDIDKSIYYARGMGAVFKKNFSLNAHFLASFAELLILRPLGGFFFNFIKLNISIARYYWLIFINRWVGFIKF